MKDNTEVLAKKIAGEIFLNQFLLVGGTALSVYLEHRLSEHFRVSISLGISPGLLQPHGQLRFC